MRKWLIGLGVVIAVLVVIAVAVPMAVPKATVKDQIIGQIESATGWRLRIDGDISVSALPFLKLEATDVGLSGAAGADGIEFLTVREIRFGLSLVSLIGGVVDVTGITLVQPNVFLEVDPSGRQSWAPRRALEEIAGDAPAETAPADNGEAGGGEAGGGGFSLDRLRFGAIEIRDGLAVWHDRRTGVKQTLAELNVTASMPSVNDAATLEGSLTWNGIPVELDLSAGNPKALAEGGESGVTGTLAAADANLTIDGSLALEPAPTFRGRVEAEADDLSETLAAFKVPAPDMPALGEFSLATGVAYGPDAASLSDLTATLDETTLTGSLEAALGGPRPTISGALALDRIDLDRFKASGGGNDTKGAGGGGDTGAIDLAPLNQADADLTLRIGSLTGGDVTVADIAGSVKLANGKLDLDIAQTRLLGGTAALTLAADGSGKAPAFAGTLKSAGLSVPDLLQLAGRNDPVDGTLETDLAFAARGNTVPALTAGLQLSGTAALRSGAVRGLGLASAFGGDKSANRIENADIDVAIAGLGKPVTATGALSWRGDRFRLDATADPAALASGAPSSVRFNITSNRLAVGFNGKASTSGKADGTVTIETQNLRDLAGWLGNPLPPGKGLKTFSFSGRLGYGGDTVSFDKAKIALDGTTGNGSGKLTLGGARPKLTAKLALATLKLDPYLAGDGKGGGGGGGGGGNRGGGWSDEPIDLSGLQAADADLDLSAKAIEWDKLRINGTKIDVVLDAGRLEAKLTRMRLYRGTGEGRLLLDGSGSTAGVEASFKLKDMAARPFLNDAADFDRIEGTAHLALDLKTSGRSQRDFVKALAGKADFDFRDGAIRGFDVAKTVKALSVDTLLGWKGGGGDKTAFSVLRADFDIKNGIAKSTGFRLAGPLVRAGGGGTVDMPKKTLDWKVDAKVVASLEGQKARQQGKKGKNAKADGDKERLAGLGVPIIIKGPWDNPRIYPDISGILNDPKGAYEKLKGLGGGLFEDGGAAGAVDALIGGKGGGEAISDLVGGGEKGKAVNKALDALGLGGGSKNANNGKAKNRKANNRKARGQKKNAGNKAKNNKAKRKRDDDRPRTIEDVFDRFN
ncbi:AsmA family protein [Rhodobium gokarnense]|uniref:Uncharacterized protein involved in outer membrane biogenesis n=1 Tax=Rhodobium gokarnense TaxID=364296 RepID=A0ABT3HE50_9HYPH|nr:AsmA family protein [Rhodobium gokarnense]MCW2308551.1 uncharacterized protein involved in outer membrane biogenesis [Rhodobium gokarnense]